jgi:subtilase family serine protease
MKQSASAVQRIIVGSIRAIPIIVLVLCPNLLAQPDRIADRVDANRRVVLLGNVNPRVQPQYDQGAVEPSLKLTYVSMALKKSAAQQADLDNLLKQQQDRSSPLFHKWLAPEEYADRFGVSRNDIAKLVNWLQGSGLTVIQIARGRNFIAFSGTAQQVQDALRTTIHYYAVSGEKHYANATEPSTPDAFAAVVAGFIGLDDFHPKAPMHLRGAPSRKLAPGSERPNFFSQSGVNILAPDDLATIYDIAPLYQNGFDGTGQSLVVAGQTNIDLNDIEAFRQLFNLSANDPQMFLVQGDTDPGIVPKELGEADLDLEWSGAIARNATIIFVYSHDVFNSAAYAIDNALAPVISYSYGTCESNLTNVYSQLVESVAQQANSEGITWVASSGDSGAADCELDSGTETTATTGLAVNFPASLPEVTGVGGTEFVEGGGTYFSSTLGPNLGTALSYIPETGWNDSSLLSTGFAASGGGVSMFFAKPYWQNGAGVPSDGQRDVPDVAFTASGLHDPYLIGSAGEPMAVGGTSAAAPTFAGILVLLNHYLASFGAQPGLGNINANLYALAQAVPGIFHDITTGNNIVPCQNGTMNCSTGSFGYTAGPGYDQVTGLGSIDAYNLVTNWAALPFVSITNLTSDTSVRVGGNINVSMTITNLGLANAGPFRMGLYLSTSPNFLSNSTPISWCDYAGLASGAANTCSGSVNLPAGLQPGTYYLAGVADILNQLVQFYQTQSTRLSDSGPVTVAPATCTYSISSSGMQILASGGSSTFAVTTQNGCSWNASSNVNWITITSGASGTGSGTVAFSVAPNSGAARTGTISVANQQFSINQLAYVNVNVALQFSNSLIYPANVLVNGTVIGSVGASTTASFTIPAPPTLLVSFQLIQPTLSGTPLGDPMIGVYNAISNPTGSYNFTINNQIGNQTYFVPFVTNTSGSALLMDVNGGLQAENRCYCVVPVGGINVAFGYYQLFSNSNVEAFGNNSNYTGNYYYFDTFTSFVESQTGILRLTFSQSP